MAEALQLAFAATSTPRGRVSVGSARSLLLTVLGEFVLPSGQAVWTSALLHALVGVGTAENSARQAIARSASAGWLEGRKDGRQVRWRLTPAGRRVIEAITEARRRLLGRLLDSWSDEDRRTLAALNRRLADAMKEARALVEMDRLK